ncbi:MAG: hypothetical protein GC162_12330 [Planctomycetes bacterium]|nr:hypothetical protein [Planctomycetota bacterium]
MDQTTLLPLIERYCDGDISPADCDTLAALLSDDAEARRLYLDYLDLHGRLQWRVRGRGVATPAVTLAAPTLSRVARRSVGYAAALVLIAAMIAVIFLSFNPKSAIQNPQSPVSVALLSDLSADAQFAAGPVSLGADLPPGRFALTRGKAQIAFRSGAVVDLTGPCEFEMTGPNRGRLDQGHLEAFVRPEAHGFTVDAPHGVRIIDLGTRFRVDADARIESRVQVLEGRVRIEGAFAAQVLKADDAATWSDGGAGLVVLQAVGRVVLIDFRGDASQGVAAVGDVNVFDPPGAFRFAGGAAAVHMLNELIDMTGRPTGITLTGASTGGTASGVAGELFTDPVAGFPAEATADGLFIKGEPDRHVLTLRLTGLDPRRTYHVQFVAGMRSDLPIPPRISIADQSRSIDRFADAAARVIDFEAVHPEADGSLNCHITPSRSGVVFITALRLQYQDAQAPQERKTP